MSDTFWHCPECKCFDASFKRVDESIDENDEEQLYECQDCGAEFKCKDIPKQTVEYGVD